MKELIFPLYCIVNLIAFCLMVVDKSKATRGQWRISEATLWLFPLLGGGLGGYLAMMAVRHKTRHWYFKFGFPILAVVQLCLLFYLFK